MKTVKKILVNNKIDLNKLKDFKVIFFDEYVKNFHDLEDLKKTEYTECYSIRYLQKKNYYSKTLFTKMNIYRQELTKCLNKIHNKNFSEDYWGLLIDQVVFITLNQIIIELPLLTKIKKKHKKIYFLKTKFNNFYYNNLDLIDSLDQDNRISFSRSIICKNLGFKEISITKDRKLEKIVKKDNFVIKILKFISQGYVRILTPSLIVDSHLGIGNAIKIFLQSFGKVLCIPSKFFFKNELKLKKKNNFLRSKIYVREKDTIDKFFNRLIRNFLPSCFLENFEFYYENSQKFKTLPLIGSAVSLINNDQFKFLSAEILKNKGNLISIQHGGFLDKRKISFNRNLIEEKYATKIFLWSSNFSLKEFFFRKKKFKFPIEKKKENILIYPTSIYLNYNFKHGPCKKYHPSLNQNFSFFKNLNINLKNKIKIKLFPGKSDYLFKKKFQKKFNVADEIFLKGNKKVLSKFKVVIINDLSTPLYELLHQDIPFIIIDEEIGNLNNSTLKKIKNLKKINILFCDPKKASLFINKNFDNIQKWWSYAIKTKIYKRLKEDLMPSNGNINTLNFNIKHLNAKTKS